MIPKYSVARVLFIIFLLCLYPSWLCSCRVNKAKGPARETVLDGHRDGPSSLPDGIRFRFLGPETSRQTRLELRYELEPETLTRDLELWITPDGGNSWVQRERATFTGSSVRFEAPDGLLGIRWVLPGSRGVLGQRPQPGDAPDATVLVDSAAPRVDLGEAQVFGFADTLRIQLPYRVSDAHLSTSSLIAEVRTQPEGPWKKLPTPDSEGVLSVASRTTDTGIEFRISATDRAGNQTRVSKRVYPEDISHPPKLELLSPRGGETLGAGEEVVIRYRTAWKRIAEKGVELRISSDRSQWQTLAAELPPSGSHTWKVPPEDGEAFFIELRARSLAGDEVSFQTPLPVLVDGLPPEVRILGPRAASTLEVALRLEARDAGAGLDRLTVYGETVKGRKHKIGEARGEVSSIVLNFPEPGEYLLTVVARDLAGNESVTQSDVPLRIAPRPVEGGLQWVHPEGGEAFRGGEALALSWRILDRQLEGLPASLALSREGGEEWQTVLEDFPNSGRVDWVVPRLNGSRFHLRLEVRPPGGTPFQAQVPKPIAIDSEPPWVKIRRLEPEREGGVEVAYESGDAGVAGVDWVQFLVRREPGGAWESRSGGLPASGAITLDLPPGRYGLVATAQDRLGNRTPRPRDPDHWFLSGSPEEPLVRLRNFRGGGRYVAGTHHLLFWETALPVGGLDGHVDVELSPDNGKTWRSMGAAPAQGPAEITFPFESGARYRLRVTVRAAYGEVGVATSDPPFELSGGSARVVYMGPRFARESRFEIRYRLMGGAPSDGSRLEARAKSRGGWRLVGRVRPGERLFAELPEGEHLLALGLRDLQQEGFDAFGAGVPVAVDRTPPELEVRKVTPDIPLRGGEAVRFACVARDRHPLPLPISLEESRDDGKTWNHLVRHLESGETFSYRVPESPGTYQLRFRAKDRAGNENVRVYSLNVLPRAPRVRLLTFGQGGVYPGASDKEVVWEVDLSPGVGPSGPGVLEFSPDGGEHWNALKEDLEVSGRWVWTLPPSIRETAVSASACPPPAVSSARWSPPSSPSARAPREPGSPDRSFRAIDLSLISPAGWVKEDRRIRSEDAKIRPVIPGSPLHLLLAPGLPVPRSLPAPRGDSGAAR